MFCYFFYICNNNKKQNTMKKLLFLMFMFANVIAFGQSLKSIGEYSLGGEMPFEMNERTRYLVAPANLLNYDVIVGFNNYENKISALKFKLHSKYDDDAIAQNNFYNKLLPYFGITENPIAKFEKLARVKNYEGLSNLFDEHRKVLQANIDANFAENLEGRNYIVFENTDDFILYLDMKYKFMIYESKALNKKIQIAYDERKLEEKRIQAIKDEKTVKLSKLDKLRFNGITLYNFDLDPEYPYEFDFTVGKYSFSAEYDTNDKQNISKIDSSLDDDWIGYDYDRCIKLKNYIEDKLGVNFKADYDNSNKSRFNTFTANKKGSKVTLEFFYDSRNPKNGHQTTSLTFEDIKVKQ